MVHFTALLASVAVLSSSVMAAPVLGRNAYMTTSSSMMSEKTTSTSMSEPPAYTTTSSTMMDDNTSTMMDDTTTMNNNYYYTTTSTSAPPMYTTTSTTMMDDNTSTMDNEMTTTTATTTYSTPSYGSGYNNWNPSYDNCVQQCMNSYGAAPSMYTPPPTTTTTDSSGGGGGSIISIIVAPHLGILRYLPFATNASVGDTIQYTWGAGPHTVTRSSFLTPCNKTTDETNFFASGSQNATFQFNVEVNETDTITYYCGIPGHCPKGMFGLINPPNTNTPATNVATMVPSLIATDPDLAMQAMYVQNQTAGTDGENWGDDIDMANVPTELQTQFIQNVWMTKMLYAMNPGMLAAGLGAVNPDGSPVKVPTDITAITSGGLATGGTTSTSAPAGVEGQTSTASSSAPTSTSSSKPGGSAKTGGAMGKSVASSAAVGLAVLVAFLAL